MKKYLGILATPILGFLLGLFPGSIFMLVPTFVLTMLVYFLPFATYPLAISYACVETLMFFFLLWISREEFYSAGTHRLLWGLFMGATAGSFSVVWSFHLGSHAI
jgi:hypothetical protein